MSKSYQQIAKKNNCPVNNQVAGSFFSFEMNLLTFHNPNDFFQFFFYDLQNTVFNKKIEACVIWNFSTKSYRKFVTLRLFFKN